MLETAGDDFISALRSTDMDYYDLLSDFVRVHILYHAAEGELYGQRRIEELQRHG